MDGRSAPIHKPKAINKPIKRLQVVESDGDQTRTISRASSIFSHGSSSSSDTDYNGNNLSVSRIYDHGSSDTDYNGNTMSIGRIFDHGPDRLLKVFISKGLHDMGLEPESVPTFWKSQICEMITLSPALQNIVYGISADRLLAITGDETYKRERLGYMGNALTHLQNALYDPKKQVEDTTFVTMFLLGIFSILSEPNASNWTKHFRGLTAIMKKRGVKSFEAYPQRVFFFFLRSFEVHRALAVEEATILAEPEWRALNDGRRELGQRLIDIMARVTKVCYGPSSAFGFEGKIQRLREASELRDELLEWWLDPEIISTFPETRIPPPFLAASPGGTKPEPYPFPNRISHATFTANLCCSNYRATMLHLHYHFFPYDLKDDYLRTLAQELCMSVDSAVAHGNLFCLLWHLDKAGHFLNDEEKRWTVQFLHQLADGQGLPIAHTVAREVASGLSKPDLRHLLKKGEKIASLT